MILVFPEETYITILPALYFLELDHFSQVSSHRLMPSHPRLVSPHRPHLVPPQHPRLISPHCPRLAPSCHPHRTSPCHPCPISPSHPRPITNHQFVSSTQTSLRFLPQNWRRVEKSQIEGESFWLTMLVFQFRHHQKTQKYKKNSRP